MSHDLIVIGGDPVAPRVALEAARQGLWTALVHKDDRNEWSKSMTADARIDHFWGNAEFVSATQVAIGQGSERVVLDSARILIATGSRPLRPQGIPFDGTTVLDAVDVAKQEPPRSAIIIGASHTGLEIAEDWAKAGSTVRVLEQHPQRWLSRGAVDLVRQAQIAGVECLFESEVVGIRSQNGRGVSAYVRNRLPIRSEVVVVAVGRVGNVETLNLEEIGLMADERDRLWCDPHGQTWEPTVYAIGSVVGFPETVRYQADLERFIRRMADKPGKHPHIPAPHLRLYAGEMLETVRLAAE
ncbi:FAD-dependent oxidoreductase [Thalassoroseus pseudoceratinae]|uniref:FAD-dependent oxidoreductase n=1 Tax=Thalassoroseus pseudoceratinae TaxID=2713176 RepID=UPI0014223CBA|nr:FAD-dependent oxidoreductase [Thalassoroseus pseudoceratinae]